MNHDTIVNYTNGVELINFNKEQIANEKFKARLQNELLTSFNVHKIEHLPENYGIAKAWSLLNSLHDYDTYNLLYINSEFWSGCGGKILDDGTYHAGVRMFMGKYSYINSGLTKPAYTLIYSIPYQIERAKKNNCTRVILTFNHHRKNLFEIMHKYLLTKKKNNIPDSMKFIALTNTEIINNTEQWILELKI